MSFLGQLLLTHLFSVSNSLILRLFLDTTTPDVSRTIIVEEGKNLHIACAANGTPLPHVEWRRGDARTISIERDECKLE